MILVRLETPSITKWSYKVFEGSLRMKCIWIVIGWHCSPEEQIVLPQNKGNYRREAGPGPSFPVLRGSAKKNELIKWTEKENHFKEKTTTMRKVFSQEKQEQETSKAVEEMSYQIIQKQSVPLRCAPMEEKNVKKKSRDYYLRCFL